MLTIESEVWMCRAIIVCMDGTTRPIPDVHAAHHGKLLVELLSMYGITVNEMKVGAYLSMPLVEGGSTDGAFADVTALEWSNKLIIVLEASCVGGALEVAKHAPNNVTLQARESWRAGAQRYDARFRPQTLVDRRPALFAILLATLSLTLRTASC